MIEKLPAQIAELKKLADEMHFGRNICEHSKRNKNVCSFPYCFKIHLIESLGKEIFDSDFPFRDYDSCFFGNLRTARKYCASDCDTSLYYFRMAEKYVSNLVILLA
jgi:hypothetical protein